jgi:hypothetical protein
MLAQPDRKNRTATKKQYAGTALAIFIIYPHGVISSRYIKGGVFNAFYYLSLDYSAKKPND